MVDEVVLITGIDIPFPPAEITIHQPTIEEIAYIGEDAFLMEYICFNLIKIC